MQNGITAVSQKNMQIQAVRGICLLCVCFIHVMPIAGFYSEDSAVVLRTIVNFCTGIFFFISAYLTNITKVKENTKAYLKKRFVNLYTPFIFYSLLYTVYLALRNGLDLSSPVNIVESVIKVLIGSNSAQLYFVIILLCYTFVSPLLIKIIERRSKFLDFIMFAVSPVYLLFSFFDQFGINVCFIDNYLPNSIVTLLPFAFFICYYLGLYFNINGFPKHNFIYLIPLVLVLVEIVNLYEFNSMGFEFNYVAGQRKVTNIIFMTAIMISFDKILILLKKINTKVLERIADYSFGIYFLHLIIIRILFDVLRLTGLNYTGNIALYFIVVLIATVVTIMICWLAFFVLDKIIKNKFLRKILCIR